MKRRLGFALLSTILVLALLVGCGGKETSTTNNEGSSEALTGGELKDGLYLIKNPVSNHGNYGMAKMEVKDGEIISFKYAEILANSGEEKNENNYNYPDGLAVIANLNEQFNEKKNLDEMDFDAVSGATHTKESFKDIVNRLLAQAEKGETYTPVYKDGVYTAKADEDSHGWLGEVMVVVRDGQIVGLDYFETAVEDMESNKVVFDEDNKPVTGSDGKPKTEPVEVKAGERKSADNYAYLDALDVVKAVQRKIIDNNGTENLDVDSITGATSTRTTMIELVEKALESAK
ncbi:FMN-binding protein [Tepidimicrobium xylanilyticum]|uniref:Major membrane immunogen, membrane-anchored lipoprotein n=1 Tax=Tepidimicrobium xylanilyticum TaxID=1123352 RepID=A0A1H3BTS2_9FIRM|nr:FMN-binding protein [Tepidimicrobium xylanilyticum]GMG97253.1 FMN-binding domain-containing protein [Tepidimicrobium xylanilyticum]SDX45307.1 Major membrane immunogen, membrane-anchored lipoprotein [Tepidimicrobium xylanilyticum]